MAISNKEVLDFLTSSPNLSDADIYTFMKSKGVSASQISDVTGLPLSDVNSRISAIAPNTTNVETSNQNPLVKLYQDTLGRTPTQAEIDSWNFGNTIDAGELDKFLGAARNEATSTMPTTGAAANIAKQILAQGTTSQWTGQGYGSAEKNAYDMGVMLAGQGITDINQLGQGTKVIPASEQQVEAGDGFTTVVVPERTVSTFVNKATGQEINPYYDKAASISPNIWGGTFAGKDSTAYGVQFDSAGKPIFYTQSGGDSSGISDYMPLIQMALMATGASGVLGNALLGTGASQVAAGALGGSLIGGATNAIVGNDWKKGALLGGAGGALGGYLQGANASVLGNASDIAMSMADSGASLSEIQNALTSQGFSADVISESLKDAANVLSPTATNIPSTSVNVPDTVSVSSTANTPTLNNLISTISQVPNIVTTAKAPEKVTPDILSSVNTLLSGGNVETPTVKVTAENTNKTEVPVITPITTVPTNQVTSTDTKTDTTDATKKDTKLTTSDVIRLAGIGTTLAAINSASSGNGNSAVQYPIVDIPSDWKTAETAKVAPVTQLTPIDFGNRNLLVGTQWEKFLDPNYGKVPAPVQFSQPSNLSFNDLMGILGSKQGYPSSSTLSINDIISGIQNQYGQAPTRTMG